MELRQVRYAVAVARRLSFTQAAAELSIAQPALSQAIASLEEDLGVKLFERTNRRVTLTDAGRAFVLRAERLLTEAEAAAEEMSAYAGGMRGRVIVGTYQSFAEAALPKLLRTFHAAYPGIEIALREGITDEMLAGLRSGAVDLFVGDLGNDGAAIEGLEQTPLYQDELVIALARNHSLATRTALRIEELRDEPFVIYRPGSASTLRLVAQTRAAGFEPRIAFETTDALTVRALVAENLGVALFPRSLGRTHGLPIALVPLAPPLMRTMLLLTRSSGYGPAARRFIDFVKAEHRPA
jgi:DNA-binding transcriptional LysR family regulator